MQACLRVHTWCFDTRLTLVLSAASRRRSGVLSRKKYYVVYNFTEYSNMGRADWTSEGAEVCGNAAAFSFLCSDSACLIGNFLWVLQRSGSHQWSLKEGQLRELRRNMRGFIDGL